MKKFISFLIATVMIVSMLPSVAAEVTTTYTYEFTPRSHGLNTEPDAATLTIEGTAEGYDKWGFVCAPGSTSRTCWELGINWNFAISDGIEYNPDKGLLPPTFTYEIYVGEAGTYQASIEKDDYDNICPNLEMYLIKKPENPEIWLENYRENLLNLSTADRFAVFKTNRYGVTEYTNAYLDVSPVKITEPGYYYLIFIPNGAPSYDLEDIKNKSSSQTFSRIRSLKLTKTDSGNTAKESILNETGGAVVPTEACTANTSVTVNKMQAVLGGATSTEVENLIVDGDGYVTVTADAKDGAGNNFLYWAKGLSTGKGKKIILPEKNGDNLYSATFKPETGMNYIIAVYGIETATEEKYFNANGQLLDWKVGDAMPTMAGYGEAKGWTPAGNGINVAAYDEPTERFTVTVNYQKSKVNTEPVEKEKITGKKYGDLVTVTAPRRFDDATVTDQYTEDYYDYEAFNYWEKKDKAGNTEIVSFDRTYSFYAYEDCTLTAVYKVFEPISKSLRKIILTNAGTNNIMAEFIGLSDAVEKGIIFGGTSISDAGIVKSAMTTGGSQYVVENDKSYTSYTGYAILTDGSVIYDK